MHNPLLSESFDPIKYINDTFKTSTEYDLNDTLVSLHKSINITKLKSKQLVASHFSQFVQCKSVIDNVYSDIKLKHITLHHYSTDNMLNLLSSLPSKHIDLGLQLHTDHHTPTTHNTPASQNILPEFVLSKLSKALENKDYKTFISLYPQHIQHPIKIVFLDSLQSDIHHTKSLSTLLKLFKYYFTIEPTTFPYQTISNTLLVNFKECINSIGKGYTNITYNRDSNTTSNINNRDSNTTSNINNRDSNSNTNITSNTSVSTSTIYITTHFTNTDIFKVTLYLKNIIKKVSATNKEPDFTNTVTILVNEYINFIKYIIYKEIGNEYNNVTYGYETIDSTILQNQNSIDPTYFNKDGLTNNNHTNSYITNISHNNHTNSYITNISHNNPNIISHNNLNNISHNNPNIISHNNLNNISQNNPNNISHNNPNIISHNNPNNISHNNLPVTSTSLLKVLTFTNKILNSYKYDTMDIEDIKREMLYKEWYGSIYNIPIFINMYGSSMFKECVIQYIKRVIIKYNEYLCGRLSLSKGDGVEGGIGKNEGYTKDNKDNKDNKGYSKDNNKNNNKEYSSDIKDNRNSKDNKDIYNKDTNKDTNNTNINNNNTNNTTNNISNNIHFYNALLVVYNTYELLNNKNIKNIGIKPSLYNTLQQELINLQVSLIIRIIENIKISSNIYMSSKSSNYKGVICSKILKVIYSVNFVESSVIEIVKNKYKEYI
ncbi:hypothetical protein CWI39_0610p0010 [Hamiltosporidium magnivora]|uniref:Exocyst complex component SEC5 n=1 Tax=Hamiltosporidium magnivora TaxID=148818 RepID=A0A4Q9LD74_9MICR|nr:hypothetical protein CWI39_0610p0010 [Hamiltosporidium magnivora]